MGALSIEDGTGAARQLRRVSTVVLGVSAALAIALLGYAGWLGVVRRTESLTPHGTPETELTFSLVSLIVQVFQTLLVGLAAVALFSCLLAWLARRGGGSGRLAAAALGLQTIGLSRQVEPLLLGWFEPLPLVAGAWSWALLLLGSYLLALALAAQWQAGARPRPTRGLAAILYRPASATFAILAVLLLAAGSPRALRPLRDWWKQRDERCLGSEDVATFCRGVEAIGVSENGHAMVTLSGAGIVVWDPSSGKQLWHTSARSSSPGALRPQVLVADDATRVIQIDHSGWVTAFARAGGQNALDCEPPQMTPVRKAGALAPDGRQLATVARDVCTFDLASGRVDRRLATDCNGTDLAYSRDGTTLWVACAQEIRAFDVVSGQRWRDAIAVVGAPTLAARSGLGASAVDTIGVSEDGAMVFGLQETPGGKATTARAWEARTGKLVSSIALHTGHDARERVAWFAPYVAIFDDSAGVVTVFDLRNGAAVSRFPGSVHAHSVGASRDGGIVVAGADFDFAGRRGPTIHSWSAPSSASARDPTAAR